MSTKLLTMILIVCGMADLRAQASRVPEPAGPAKAAPEPEEMDEEAGSEEEGDPVVPEDLLEDEHMREEYGVNQFTTPSIRKIFGQLDQLGSLPYEKLRRDIPKTVSTERTRVALALGILIGDGFLSVQTEKVDDLESVGRSVLKHAKVLSAGARVTEHAKSLLENGTLGDWKGLREDLAATQKDVEAEMVLLRDVQLAHLIAMGGWLRGLQIASAGAMEGGFNPERAAVMARTDLTDYFVAMLADLDPEFAKLEHVKKLRAGIEELRGLIDMPEGKSFDEGQVKKLYEKATELVNLVSATK
ncbi:MAG: hypothetical protein RLZZ179_2074 [Verrucomicrobiota bacterium]|jgi:hypothetical protein